MKSSQPLGIYLSGARGRDSLDGLIFLWPVPALALHSQAQWVFTGHRDEWVLTLIPFPIRMAHVPPNPDVLSLMTIF